MVLDPTAPTEFVLRRPAVWAIGQDVPWTPCFEDPEVARAFADSVADEPAVARVELSPGPARSVRRAELTVGLALHPGLDQGDVQALVGRLQQRWTADAVVAERVDSMRWRCAARESRLQAGRRVAPRPAGRAGTSRPPP